MLATLQALGVMPSFTRPSVSNENPYSESRFKTLKYRPAYPLNPFEKLLDARQWVSTFVDWYNNEHRHSAMRGWMPRCYRSVAVYEASKQACPERWSGDTRNWQHVSVTHLNPDQKIIKVAEQKERDEGLKMAA